MNNPDPASASGAWKFLVGLCKSWWIPVVTTVLGLATAAIIIYFMPPIFVSSGSLWETEKLRLPDGAAFTDDRENYLGTQDQLLRSKMMSNLTQVRMWALATNQIVSGKDGNPLPVTIQVLVSPKSSVYTIEARSADPAYTPAYLNNLMQEYLEYRKVTRSNVSGETLTSISEQVERLERDMKVGQDALTAYEQSNNLAALREDRTFEASYLVKLKTELADDQLEKMSLDRPSLSEAETAQRQTLQIKIDNIQKFIKEWEAKVAADNGLIASADSLKQNIERNQERNQGMFDRLSALLQNVDISRNIDQGTLAILQSASSATRSYARDRHLLAVGGFGGLGFGLGIIVLLGFYRASRCNLPQENFQRAETKAVN